MTAQVQGLESANLHIPTVELDDHMEHKALDMPEFTGRFRGDLPDRTFRFAKTILDLIDELPRCDKGWAIGKQLVRSGTSIGANVAEADEALTDIEFAHRCSIARKECSETRFWLRLCRDKKLLRAPLVDEAIAEANEFLRILTTILRKLQTRTTVGGRS